MQEDIDPYIPIDSILLPWSERHGLELIKQYRDDTVRTFWIFDSPHQNRVQVWLEPPNQETVTTIHAAQLDMSLPSKWSRSTEVVAKKDELEKALEDIRVLAFEWAGPSASATGMYVWK